MRIFKEKSVINTRRNALYKPYVPVFKNITNVVSAFAYSDRLAFVDRELGVVLTSEGVKSIRSDYNILTYNPILTREYEKVHGKLSRKYTVFPFKLTDNENVYKFYERVRR